MSLTKHFSAIIEKPKTIETPKIVEVPKIIETPKIVEVPKIIETSKNLNKFTVYGKVNSKGIRYEVIKIIEAENEDIASSIYKERIKKEFSGIRNITCIKPSIYKEEDIEYSKEIEIPKTAENKESQQPKIVINNKSIELPKDLTNIEIGCIVFYLLSLKLHELKLYTCYYSPKKKLNNSFRKNNLLFYTSFNKIDALNDIKNEISSNGLDFREKYVHELQEIDIETAFNNEFIRKELIKRTKERFGNLEKAHDKFKAEVLNSPKCKDMFKEELLNV